jgi:hypothetical protein
MTVVEAEQALRSGEGEIRPIVDWLALEEDPSTLLPLLTDEETRSSMLYVYSELPSRRLTTTVRDAISELLGELQEGSREQAWALEALDQA